MTASRNPLCPVEEQIIHASLSVGADQYLADVVRVRCRTGGEVPGISGVLFDDATDALLDQVVDSVRCLFQSDQRLREGMAEGR